MSLAKVYARNLHKQLAFYYAQWLPNTTIRLGTVGVLEDGHFFRPLTTLEDLGIDFDPARDVLDDASSTPLDLVSSEGVIINVKLAGEVSTQLPSVPEGKAGLGIEFSREGAFTLKAADSYEPRIRDLIGLERNIRRAHEQGAWNWEYAVVYAVVTTPYADIVVSESASSTLELQVTADGDVGSVELGNAQLGLTVKRKSGAVLNMLGSKNVTPAFQLAGLKRKWFGGSQFGPKRLMGMPSPRVATRVESNDEYYVDILGGEELADTIAASTVTSALRVAGLETMAKPLRDQVVEIVSAVSGVPVREIQDGSRLFEDLGLIKESRRSLAPGLQRIAQAYNPKAVVTRPECEKLLTVKGAVALVTKKAARP